LRVLVLGAGAWGTALAVHLARSGHTVGLVAKDTATAHEIDERRESRRYLPGVMLPDGVSLLSTLERAQDHEMGVVAVPSPSCRTAYRELGRALPPGTVVVSATKGLEVDTLRRMTEVAAAEAPDLRLAVLSGPSFAQEVAEGQPTAVVAASAHADVAEMVQSTFASPTFRVYSSDDVIGVELAGALKNVIAIGAGMAHGLDYGDNTKAALITRGLAELARLGVALGGEPLTFAGLAGMGDLIATCSSPQSRNRHVGVELGKGRTLDEIVAEMNMVAEGVKTTAAVLDLAAREKVDMPLAEFVGRVLYQGAHPADLVPELMGRRAKPELHGIR
jgi:glycerol-3-phosphate dehydrogenase (NAD(P)+)